MRNVGFCPTTSGFGFGSSDFARQGPIFDVSAHCTLSCSWKHLLGVSFSLQPAATHLRRTGSDSLHDSYTVHRMSRKPRLLRKSASHSVYMQRISK